MNLLSTLAYFQVKCITSHLDNYITIIIYKYWISHIKKTFFIEYLIVVNYPLQLILLPEILIHNHF